MPRKTKETTNSKSSKTEEKNLTSKLKETVSTIKTKIDKKSKTTKKEEPKVSTATKRTTKKTSTKAKTSAKKTTKSKKVEATTKTKSATKRKSTKSKTTTKKVAQNTVVSFSPEYYDLPFKYNKTVVKILAQTPNNLFIYWEISDDDRENLKKQYGEYFFEITKPILIVHNETMNTSFELDINDFANSWYLELNDTNCDYKVELGRRPIPINYNYIPQYDINENGPLSPIETPYIYISSSNNLETPNDHILFTKQNKIYFKNIKTNQIIEKDITDFPNIYKNNVFVSIYELYKDLYEEEIFNNILDLRNPSSGNPSSGSLSSKFK